jgi:hypothetical protein
MSKTVPIRELRRELSHVIDQVADLREHVVVRVLAVRHRSAAYSTDPR